jgi:8-oxo-dGTP pyrophosphatase MutT (NUDIX family)
MDPQQWTDFGHRLAAARRSVEVAEGARRAAVAAALRQAEDGLEVLLMRRAERAGDRWSGQISLPGGHVEPTDQDAVAAAIRETREEVGLDLARDAEVLGELSPIQAMARGRRVDLWITPVVFLYRGQGTLELGPEADDAFWLPVGPVRRGELDAEHRYEHEGLVYPLPSWRFGERVVWGLTHRILGEVLAVLP